MAVTDRRSDQNSSVVPETGASVRLGGRRLLDPAGAVSALRSLRPAVAALPGHGRHPLWPLKDLLPERRLRPGERVLDLGCGKGRPRCSWPGRPASRSWPSTCGHPRGVDRRRGRGGGRLARSLVVAAPLGADRPRHRHHRRHAGGEPGRLDPMGSRLRGARIAGAQHAHVPETNRDRLRPRQCHQGCEVDAVVAQGAGRGSRTRFHHSESPSAAATNSPPTPANQDAMSTRFFTTVTWLGRSPRASCSWTALSAR